MAATHIHAGIPANMDIKTIDDTVIDSYEACATFLQGAIELPIASNVWIRRAPDDSFEVVLYHTPIVRYYPDSNTFSVDNGGYNTLTTARRISQFTPKGYSFGHHKKKLRGWGSEPLHHGIRIPVRKEDR